MNSKLLIFNHMAKQSKAYRRVMASTRKTLQASLESKDRTKIALDKVYRSLGDVTSARSIGQLPRGPTRCL